MGKEIILILLGIVVVAIGLIILAIYLNNKKQLLIKEVEEVNVRFNAVKTIPIAFKLNKAQAMAKRNEEASERLSVYQKEYETASNLINEIGETIDDIQDSIESHNTHRAKEYLIGLDEKITDCETKLSEIDKFLDEFSKKETQQREYSAKLKEQYGEIKNKINGNSNYLSIAYETLTNKLSKCEELFSDSEELMYANDYELAQDKLNKIASIIVELAKSYEMLPALIKDAKGVIPVLYDEANRQYSLCKQRGVYLDTLSISSRLDRADIELNNCNRILSEAMYEGVEESLNNIKDELNTIINTINSENDAFSECKTSFENVKANINSIKTLYSYVENLYQNENEHFDMREISEYLDELKINISRYQTDVITLSGELTGSIKLASVLKGEFIDLFNHTQTDLEKITNYKRLIDKNTSDEERAKTQLIKLQVVLNEIEVKVLEYHLPTIASNYKDDLKAGRERIVGIKKILSENPLDVEKLNKTLDEAIAFIYTFFNNVNNIVGMAVMVENAIVFGNKYRSSNSDIDRDLSKSEFSYLNGEYTKALKMAIESMETLFPNKANEKILENN